MSNQLTTYHQPMTLAEVPAKGREVLEHLRNHAGMVVKEVEEIVYHTPLDDDGNPRTGILGKPLKVPKREINEDGTPGEVVKEVVTVQKMTPNRKRLAGIDAQFFYRFGALVAKADEDDLERLHGIIGRQRFDIGPALAAYEARDFVFDQSVRPSTWDDCEKLRSVTLVSLKAYKGQEKAQALITKMLELFLLKFGKRSDISPALVRELAGNIIADFPSLTIAQAKMILNLATKQDTATDRTYNIDYATIYSLFADMYDDRGEWSAQKIVNDHLAMKGDPFERSARPNTRMAGESFIDIDGASDIIAAHIKSQADLAERRNNGE